MGAIGFSTGAIALGDFRGALETLRRFDEFTAIELSALRERELPELVAAMPDLDLSHFQHISVHAPSAFCAISEARAVDLLEPLAVSGFPVILHPDAVSDLRLWSRFGSKLFIENMDKRKRTGRTVGELERIFASVPDAMLCFDIAHARQVDPTMSEAWLILKRFGHRLAQVHLSEVDLRGRHTKLTMAAKIAFPPILSLISAECPVIVESRIAPDEALSELNFARSLCAVRPGATGARAF